jgi:hypothetical protein
MAGDTIIVACPDGKHTLIADVKRLVTDTNPALAADRQRLMLAPQVDRKANADSGARAPTPLVDTHTVGACGIKDGATLELLMEDVEWSESSAALISDFTHAGSDVDVSRRELDSDAAKAIAWALENKVCQCPYRSPYCLTYRTVLTD